MLPFTPKYQSARSEYVAFPNQKLKDTYVSHSSLNMGFATVKSILIGTMYTSPNIPLLMHP
jgi:hypothetical protein